MSITREGQFLLSGGAFEVLSLGLESSHLAACVAEVHTKPYRGVFGSPAWGFTERTLDVLAALPPLRAAWFTEVNLKSIDGLYSQLGMESLGVNPKRPGIDFARFPLLKRLVLTYIKQDRNLGRLAALSELHLWSYNPASRSFADLELPPDLTTLQINWANPSSLDGLPAMPALTRLEVHRCRHLSSLDGLARIAPNLQFLLVASSGRVSIPRAADIHAALPRLHHAHVGGRSLIAKGVVAA